MDVQHAQSEAPELNREPEAPPKRKRGRPPGSKTKNRTPTTHAPGERPPPRRTNVRIEVPPAVLEGLATVPFSIATTVVARRTGGVVVLHFTEKHTVMVTDSFKAWLASKDVALTPGWALIAAYSMAFGEAFNMAQADLAARVASMQTAPAPAPEAPPAQEAAPSSPTEEGFPNGAFREQPAGGGAATTPPV